MRLPTLAIAGLFAITPVTAQVSMGPIECVNAEQLETAAACVDTIDYTVTGSVSPRTDGVSLLLSDSELVLPGTLSLLRRSVRLQITNSD